MRIPKAIHASIKRWAKKTGMKVGAIAEQALREWVRKQEETEK